MRALLLLASLAFAYTAGAQECDNDYSGIQRTSGFDYEIDSQADLARTSVDFLNAASNWLYFTGEGTELQGRLVGILRMRDLPVYFPACNDIGQCASISVQSISYTLFGIDWPGVHLGYQITATINGMTSQRFIQTDSSVHYNFLSEAAAADKRCRDNQGNLLDEPPPESNNDDDGEEFSEDEEENETGDESDEGDWGDDWVWEDEEEDEPCEACEFWFDSDEDGDVDDGPYGPTDEEWIEEL